MCYSDTLTLVSTRSFASSFLLLLARVLKDYSIHSVTPGSDSLGTVVCIVSPEGRNDVYRGEGSDSDILVASAKACVGAHHRFVFVFACCLLVCLFACLLFDCF